MNFFNFFSDYVIDINNEQQRTLILDICFQILSFPYREEMETLFLGYYEFSSHEDATKLLQKVFKEKKEKDMINVFCFAKANNVRMEFYVDYKKNTLDNVMPIIKDWYKPFIKELQNQHNVKIKEWRDNYDKQHCEDIRRNEIINNINNIFPGFKYLVDFKWSYNDNENEVGDLVFKSDYGIYLVLETKWLNNRNGEIAIRDRINNIKHVRERARKFKELAKIKFNDHKVIGISYTNDSQEPIHFVDTIDKMVISAIGKSEGTPISSLVIGGSTITTLAAAIGFAAFQVLQKPPLRK